jgi:hypothetical protein
MAGSWTTDRFPQFADQIHRLVEQHRELEDEPLHLAITYQPAARDQQHIYLLEVVGAFEGSENPGRDLFEGTFGPASGFPLHPGQELHLILTNPSELETALRDGWPLAMELVEAIRAKDYAVLHEDEVGRESLAILQAEAHRREAVRG